MKPVPQKINAVCLAFAITASGFVSAAPAQDAEAHRAMPIVSEVWVKTTVPGGTVSAAYMHIKSASPLKLVKAESTIAGIVEIHNMKMNDGVMQMKALDAVDVPAGKLVELKPGGMHIMLLKVKKPITPGDKVPLTLTFEAAGKKPVVVKLDVIARENTSSGHSH